MLRFIRRRGEVIRPREGGGHLQWLDVETVEARVLCQHSDSLRQPQATKIGEGTFAGSTQRTLQMDGHVLEVLEILSSFWAGSQKPLALLLNIIWPQSPCLYP